MARRLAAAAAVVAASVLALSGCASAPASGGDGRIMVVASTNVYGQIAQEVGGDLVDVTSIIHSPAQDPHSFEPSARDQLHVSRADLLIENGGGYDPFVDALIRATKNAAPVVTASELSPAWAAATGDSHEHGSAQDAAHPQIAGFNEHVWYDLSTVTAVASAVANSLGRLAPADSATFAANAARFAAGVTNLDARVADIAAAHAGSDIFVSEPVPLYLTELAGLVDVTPPAFSHAVEEGQDVAPATLLEALRLLRGGEVKTVIVNSQTGGAETDAVIAQARAQGIPVLEFSEILPPGTTYLSWMGANIAALGKALDA